MGIDGLLRPRGSPRREPHCVICGISVEACRHKSHLRVRVMIIKEKNLIYFLSIASS
jgi:hypothetical protein